jgi:hypothetical protein
MLYQCVEISLHGFSKGTKLFGEINDHQLTKEKVCH